MARRMVNAKEQIRYLYKNLQIIIVDEWICFGSNYIMSDKDKIKRINYVVSDRLFKTTVAIIAAFAFAIAFITFDNRVFL